MGRPISDISGQKFGRLTAVRVVAQDRLSKQAIWSFICDCGTEKLALGAVVKRGVISSCGCYAADVRRARPLRSTFGRFWSKVKVTGDWGDCWEWQGAIDPKTGYGRFGLGRRQDGTIGAHQYAYQQRYEFVEDGHEVCHRCNNRRCVNPDHLYEGTRKDNMQQAKKQGRLVREFKPWSAERRERFEQRKSR